MNATLRTFSSDVRKELSIQDDRTESDNRIEVTLLKGIAENNLPHTVRCKSTKPPYAERHVRWCGRSVNMKVGDKCLLRVTFTSYPIFVTQNKEKMTLRERFGTLCSRLRVEFQCRIAAPTILSKVVKVVQVSNATDATIARSVLLPTTHTKPIFLTLIPKSLN